jgi:serine/threonine protein kinase
MGVVWFANDEFLHRDVAIKEIQPRGREIHDTDPEVRRALREARAAAKLSEHPGIITVHDVVTDERGLPWIVMQLLNGRSLNTVLDAEGPMPVDRAARIGIQVLEALDYAHKAGVLHRDVKPGNVMLVGDKAGDKVVLTDFGIAVIDGASVLTATGQLPGAPEYIAPERILGEEALPSADLWSVGIMLYGMVVGRTPFHRADIQATLSAALTREPDPDPSVGRLAPVVKGLLRKKPAERMTAEQAIEKLGEIASVPSSVPTGLRVRVEYPTKEDNPDAAVTVVGVTVPNTQIALPSFQPHPPRTMHDAPTLDPVPPRRPRPPRTALIVSGALLAVVAVVVTVVLVVQSNGDGDNSASPTTRSTTTTPVEPDAPLKRYPEDDLGFTIRVPVGWERSSSPSDTISEVSWQARREDPKAGVLEVRVRRDTASTVTSATTYLTEVDSSYGTNQNKVEYDPSPVSGDDTDTTADLEYTYHNPAGSAFYHERVRAVVSDDLYTLTFSLYASEPATAQRAWEAAQPLIARIQESFELT